MNVTQFKPNWHNHLNWPIQTYDYVSDTVAIAFCSLITEYMDGDTEDIYRVAAK